MSDKQTMATVHYDGGDWGRNFTLAPGDVLEIKAGLNDGYVPAFKVTKAKVLEPQPVHLRYGQPYRYDPAKQRYEYRNDTWREISFGRIGCLDQDYLRFLADLKDATEKWENSK